MLPFASKVLVMAYVMRRENECIAWVKCVIGNISLADLKQFFDIAHVLSVKSCTRFC